MCVKIGDLGLAAKLDDLNERKKTLCGTVSIGLSF